jgi:acyl dehydratase
MNPLYLEDLYEGQIFESGGRTLTEADVVMFVGLSGDSNPLHTDEEFAKTTPYGTRIVPGLLGLSVAAGLMHRMGVFDGTALAALGIKNWVFKAPIHFGDTVRFRMTVTGVRRTSRGDRGVVERHFELLNQRSEVVQEGDLALMVKARDTRPASP